MSKHGFAVGWLVAGGVVLGFASFAWAEGDVTFGSQWWEQTANEAKFQEFREVPRGGFLESFMLREWKERNSVKLWGANALRHDQSANLGWTNGARWRLDVGYLEIPHLYSQIARTPYAQVRPGVFVLPDTLQRVNQDYPNSYTNTMNDLLAATPAMAVKLQTRVTDARLRSRPARGWLVEVTGSNRVRSGAKPYGGSFGFNSAVEILEPIDQSMAEGEVRASYHRERLTLQASGGLSLFDNRISALRWDNPKRITDRTYAGAYVAGDGTAAGQLALYPDNRVLRGNLALGLQLPRRSALSATIGLSRAEQDEDFLPYTINTAILQPDTFPLPAKNADAKATVLTGDYRLTSRALDRVTGTLRLQQYRYDNETPELTFAGYSRLDQAWVVGPVHNHPFGNEQLTTGIDLDYAPLTNVTVGGTYEFRTREHTLREVEKDKENVFGGRVRVRPVAAVRLEGRYRRGEREIEDSTFVEEYKNDAGALIEQPGLRRYDVADRTQDDAGAGVTWALGERADLSASYGFLRNDYDESRFGLVLDEQQTVATEATIHVSDRLDLVGGYGFAQVKTDQRSRESGASIATADSLDWMAKLKDQNTFVFGGADWRPGAGKLGLSARYEFSRSRGVFDLENSRPTLGNRAKDLPGTLSRRHDVSLEASYQVLAATELAARYAWEEFDFIDFANKDVPFVNPASTAFGPANAIYLGDGLQDYRAHRAALVVRHRF